MPDMSTNDYFDRVREECIATCSHHSLEEIAEGMFTREEIISTFLRLEERDEANEYIAGLIAEHLPSARKIYIPGAGIGTLGRKVAEKFQGVEIFQIDVSRVMVKACREASEKYPNIDTEEGNILTFPLPACSFNAIVAYGILRYINPERRTSLVTSWREALTPNGVVIVGEGIAEGLVRDLKPQGYTLKNAVEKEVNLFRHSLFYLLCRRYETDRTFQREVNAVAAERKINFAEVAAEIAGHREGKVYAKIFQN